MVRTVHMNNFYETSLQISDPKIECLTKTHFFEHEGSTNPGRIIYNPLCGHSEQFLAFSPYWTILNHSRSICAIMVHSGPCWTILGHSGKFWTHLNHPDAIWTILNHTGSLWTILNYPGPFWIVLSWAILQYSQTSLIIATLTNLCILWCLCIATLTDLHILRYLLHCHPYRPSYFAVLLHRHPYRPMYFALVCIATLADLCICDTFAWPPLQTYVFCDTFALPPLQTYVFGDVFSSTTWPKHQKSAVFDATLQFCRIFASN